MSLIPYLFDTDWTQQTDVSIDAVAASVGMAPPVPQRLSEGNLQEHCRKLEGRIGQLNLVVEALVRMSVSNGTIKPKELAELMQAIDQEDGQGGGQYNENQPESPEWCPECEARIPPGKTHCVFCGLRFEDGIEHVKEIGETSDPYHHVPEWCPDCEARIPYGKLACTFCGCAF